MIILVMGVAGSGKSTIGAAIARRLGCPFVEGDQFHPPENRRKMAAGIPLEDADRLPWLRAIRQEIDRLAAEGSSAVIACSALKRSYREILRDGVPVPTYIVYLRGDPDILAGRIAGRSGHFFPPELLTSQLKTLEDPTGEAGVITVDISEPADQIVRAALAELPRP